MNRIRNLVGKINKDGKFLHRLLIVLGVVAMFTLITIVIAYATRSQIRYTLQKADCSQSAIDARNQEEGGDSKACILVINATNLKDTSESVDWLGTGGGPFAGWHPMIRINTAGGKFCYAGVNFEDINNLGPYESRNLRIGCSNSSEKMPKEYDAHSDENPVSIEIDDWSDVILAVEPIR
jgi:hypothetical protein